MIAVIIAVTAFIVSLLYMAWEMSQAQEVGENYE